MQLRQEMNVILRSSDGTWNASQFGRLGGDQPKEVRSDARCDQRPSPDGPPDEMHVQFHSISTHRLLPAHALKRSISLRRRLFGLLAPGFSRGLLISRLQISTTSSPTRR